jgi:type III secretion protein N (ATPase)
VSADGKEKSQADADAVAGRLSSFDGLTREGRVTAVAGQVIRGAIPDARLGELCRIDRRGASHVLAEIVGFDRDEAVLMPLSDMADLAADATIRPVGTVTTFPAGDAVRGRVLDALGRPIDGRGPLAGAVKAVPLMSPPPHPMRRKLVDEPVPTGIRAIDGVLTIGRGQRVGIFAEAGGGKSTLLGMIARFVKADRVVLALIGERGREVATFLENELGPQGRDKCTVVVSTSDQPSLLRLRAAYAATAVAEEARRRGEHVVLMMDSVTRFARALRDAGLAAGEPPGRGGYPASVAQRLPQLFERAGNDENGYITAFYTVLVEGGDMQEPVAHETRSLLDGHIVLSPKVRYRPSIDVRQSESRVRSEIAGEAHEAAAERAKWVIATYEDAVDQITTNLYKEGSNRDIDDAIERIEPLKAFLAQHRAAEPAAYEDTVRGLVELMR